MTQATNNHLASIVRRMTAVSQQAAKEFSGLSADALNWKPAAGKWSIAQCIDHLIRTNESYFPLLDKLAGKYSASLWEQINPLSRYTGKSMVASLGKNVQRPYVAPKLFAPSGKNMSTTVIDSFTKHQQVLIGKLQKLEHLDAGRTMVSSPAAALITFPLADCLEILAGHEERHLEQALRIKQDRSFPG